MAYRRSSRSAYSGRRSGGYTRRTAGYRRASARRTTGRRRSGGVRNGTIRIVVEQLVSSVAAAYGAGPQQVVAQTRNRQF